MKALIDYCRHHYDWRRCERMLNGFALHRIANDGLDIALLHIRSAEPNALPLIMTHGWPGSIIEFHKVVALLVDPVRHGGPAGQAFHLILPCLLGYGFSQRPSASGWGAKRIARAWALLMERLGYDRYVAQGGTGVGGHGGAGRAGANGASGHSPQARRRVRARSISPRQKRTRSRAWNAIIGRKRDMR